MVYGRLFPGTRCLFVDFDDIEKGQHFQKEIFKQKIVVAGKNLPYDIL